MLFRSLRAAIVALAGALGVPVPEGRRRVLEEGDAEALQRVFDALARDRAWPEG